jgi:hypothetical protein
MEKLSQAIASKFSSLQRRFESILENDFDHKVEESDRVAAFEPSRDLSLVRGLSLGLPDDHIDRAIVAFSRLAMLFDAGVLLENVDGQWRAQASFHKGHTQLLKNNNGKNSIQLPQMNMLTVLKTSSSQMLQKLQLSQLDPQNRTTCLLVKVTPDFAFMLFSSLADLWLKEHIEHVRTELINGFAD